MNEITALTFRKMIYRAMKLVKKHQKFINSLNVFPVPDGDTGNNMYASLSSGNKYVMNDHSKSVGKLSQDFAQGLLMGARGNSGVILSQIFRGFAKVAKTHSTLTASTLAKALQNSKQVAYKSVMSPKEGTILTVIRVASQKVNAKVKQTTDLKKILSTLYTSAEYALEQTPKLMALLRKAGVVDSGGQGLVYVFQAFDEVVNGKQTSIPALNPSEMQAVINRVHKHSAQVRLNPDYIKYTYCTQMTVRFGRGKEYKYKFNYDKFYNYLAKLGNSLLVANDNDVVKVHVHTEHPGKVLAWGQLFGDLTKVKVDNMHRQQEVIIAKDKKKKPAKPKINTAVVSVVSGIGLKRASKSLGVSVCIDGGQTMNPDTQTILNAINKCNSNQVIVLPNNSNIMMSAKEAVKQSSKPAKVVATKTINQGLAVMLGYDPSHDAKANYKDMSDNLDEVKSGAVVKATRDSSINDMKIKRGQYLGLVNNQIVCNAKTLDDVALDMIKHHMLDDDSEIVTLFYGQHEHKPQIDKLKQQILKISPELESEVHDGGQPVYPLLVSVE